MAKIIFRRNVNDKYMYDMLVCPSYKLHGKPAPPVLAATIHSDTVGDMGIDTDGDQVHDKENAFEVTAMCYSCHNDLHRKKKVG